MGNKHSEKMNESDKHHALEKEYKIEESFPIIPPNAETIIIVLGQRLLPDGKPSQRMVERVNKAYSLLTQNDMDFSTAYFIVSGSDVSNTYYNIKEPNEKHMTEAQAMFSLMIAIHNDDVDMNRKNTDPGFGSHILLEHKAMSTIDNFYNVFRMIIASNVSNKIKQLFVVTSDYHMKRSKLYFDIMFFHEQQQMIGNAKDFNYEQKIHFVSSETKWKDEDEKVDRLFREEKYYNMPHLKLMANQTANKLWMSINLLGDTSFPIYKII